jgi:hypothetical protein
LIDHDDLADLLISRDGAADAGRVVIVGSRGDTSSLPPVAHEIAIEDIVDE